MFNRTIVAEWLQNLQNRSYDTLCNQIITTLQLIGRGLEHILNCFLFFLKFKVKNTVSILPSVHFLIWTDHLLFKSYHCVLLAVKSHVRIRKTNLWVLGYKLILLVECKGIGYSNLVLLTS